MLLNASVPAHGGQLRQLAERFGIHPSGLLDFSANINPEGPPASVVTALRTALDEATVLTSYPDLEESELKHSIAGYAGIAPNNISVANGVVPLLETALRTLSIHHCLLPVPSFGEYRRALERAEITVTPHPLSLETDFRYDPDDLLAALEIGRHDALLIANPQNPSGVLCERDRLISLIEAAAKLKVYVLLDEAFIEYALSHSLSSEVERLPNLIIFRSMTKFYGIPGLRVAYSVANSSFTRQLNEKLPPWPVTTLAAIAARTALADDAYATRTLALNRRRREQLISGMRAIGIHTYPSVANFLLLRLPTAAESHTCWKRLILDHQIVVRDCSNFEGLPLGHLRCAVQNDHQNARLLEALGPAMSNPSGTPPHPQPVIG